MGADPQGFTERRPAQRNLGLHPSRAWLGRIAHLCPTSPSCPPRLLPALNGRTPASEGRMPTLAVERSHRTPNDEATSRMVLLSSETASRGMGSWAQRRSTPLLAAMRTRMFARTACPPSRPTLTPPGRWQCRRPRPLPRVLHHLDQLDVEILDHDSIDLAHLVSGQRGDRLDGKCSHTRCPP